MKNSHNHDVDEYESNRLKTKTKGAMQISVNKDLELTDEFPLDSSSASLISFLTESQISIEPPNNLNSDLANLFTPSSPTPSPCRYQSDILTLSPMLSRKLFTLTPQKQQNRPNPEDIEVLLCKSGEKSQDPPPASLLVENVEHPVNIELDQNLAAVKFRFRAYFGKLRNAVERHRRLYQTLGAFKRFTVAIISKWVIGV